MRNARRRFALSLSLSLLGSLSLAPLAAAGKGDAKPSIEAPWVRESIPGQSSTAAYLEIRSLSDRDDALVGASSDAVETIEIHTMVHRGSTMVMKRLERLPLPAGGVVALAPGGDHLMLFGPKRSLGAGDRVRLVLTFERAGAVEVDALVRGLAVERHEHR